MATANLSQSRFYTPAFNSAIFDGPLRIYFAQIHEAQALQIYFAARNRFAQLLGSEPGGRRHQGWNLVVLMYPTSDLFTDSFGHGNSVQICQDEEEALYIGVSGPVEGFQMEPLLQAMEEGFAANPQLQPRTFEASP